MRSTRLLLLLVTVLALSSAVRPFGQVAGGRGAAPLDVSQQGPPPVGTGFIAGQVVDVPSGKPVPEAIVRINGRLISAGRGNAASVAQVVADAQGRFIFGSLPAGLYVIQGTKAGYVVPSGGTPSIIELADAEKVIDARLRLAKTASLSGTLRDAVGDPIVGTGVLVLSRAVVNGQQTWQLAGKAVSDDRGFYRLGNLTPADYVVCACGRDPIPIDSTLLTTIGADPLQLMNVAARALSAGGDVVSMDSSTRTFAPTFHQNSTTLARATKTTLAPGEEKTGLDMSLEMVRATRVLGAILGAPGPVQAQSMRLVPAGEGGVTADMFSIPPILVQPDGRFDFAMVPPGQYRLVVVYRDSGGRAGGPSGAALGLIGGRSAPSAPVGGALRGGGPPQAPPLWANELVNVGEAGVTGLSITLNRSPSIAGRVQCIGGSPQPTAQILTNRASVLLLPFAQDVLAAMAGTTSSQFAEDATFTIAGAVPGRYILTATPLPGFTTFKSVMVGGVDLTDLPFEVADRDIANVVVTYVDTPLARLTVTTNAAQTTPPYDDAWAMVFPADRKYWAEPAAASRRFRAAEFSTHGSVALDGLPAGDYFVMVGTGRDSQDWIEAGKLETLSRKAQRISLNDGEKKSLEVRR